MAELEIKSCSLFHLHFTNKLKPILLFSLLFKKFYFILQNFYKLDALEAMDKYHLISDEPSMIIALQAMKQLSDVSQSLLFRIFTKFFLVI